MQSFIDFHLIQSMRPNIMRTSIRHNQWTKGVIAIGLDLLPPFLDAVTWCMLLHESSTLVAYRRHWEWPEPTLIEKVRPCAIVWGLTAPFLGAVACTQWMNLKVYKNSQTWCLLHSSTLLTSSDSSRLSLQLHQVCSILSEHTKH